MPAAVSAAKPEGRAAAAEAHLSPAGRQAADTGLRQIDRLTAELDPLRRQLDMHSRRQPGCAALRRAHFGIGYTAEDRPVRVMVSIVPGDMLVLQYTVPT